jgi:hypothetical protein
MRDNQDVNVVDYRADEKEKFNFQDYLCDVVVLLVDDNPVFLNSFSEGAQRVLRSYKPPKGAPKKKLSICKAESIADAAEHLEVYTSMSPGARIFGILDFNFELAPTMDRGGAPTGKKADPNLTINDLFKDLHFMHYVGNGGVVCIYTGEPARAVADGLVQSVHNMWEYTAGFVVSKEVEVGRVIKTLRPALAGPEAVSVLRTQAEKSGYDLTRLLQRDYGRTQ